MTTSVATQVSGQSPRSTSQEIRIELGGDPQMRTQVSDEMLADLRQLLVLAGYGGKTFALHAQAKIHGTPHTAGLYISSPDLQRGGVLVAGQYKGNGSRVQCLLMAADKEDPGQFRDKLRHSLEALRESKTRSVGSARRPDKQEGAQDPSLDGFTKDAQSVELLRMSLWEKHPTGYLSKAAFVAFLEDWGFDAKGRVTAQEFLVREKYVTEKKGVYELKPLASTLAAQIVALEALSMRLEPLMRRREKNAERRAQIDELMKPLAEEKAALGEDDAKIGRELADPVSQLGLARLEKVRKAMTD